MISCLRFTFQAKHDGFEVHLELPNGRGQSVFLENSEHPAGDRLLLIYSICCPALTEVYEHALRLNAEVSHDRISIRNIDGVPSFVMDDTYPRATVDGEEIRRSVVEVGLQADNIERMLTGVDINRIYQNFEDIFDTSILHSIYNLA